MRSHTADSIQPHLVGSGVRDQAIRQRGWGPISVNCPHPNQAIPYQYI
ncbi:hypothetical protein RSSM_04917 [Rhodopirellula sallentina SM41]|uniref:Uncharacterized protein n=1 Tax=Rhodopirellula sallentina SM41 TaxID=1263870 RepID=M5TWU7_9BACT|nr:hypothetical protein RSSM_04917 [Rhodopirellula sallentina SM41]